MSRTLSWMCTRCGATLDLDVIGGPPPAPVSTVWRDLSGDAACTPDPDGSPRGHIGVVA